MVGRVDQLLKLVHTYYLNLILFNSTVNIYLFRKWITFFYRGHKYSYIRKLIMS